MTCSCKIYNNALAMFLDMEELLRQHRPDLVSRWHVLWPDNGQRIADFLEEHFPEFPWGSSLVTQGACNLKDVLEARDANDKLLFSGARSGPCKLGVGCDEYGACYADYHGRPDMCGRNQGESK